MGIEFTKAYVANGKTYATLNEAKIEALIAIFRSSLKYPDSITDRDAAAVIVEKSDLVLDLLTTNDSSRPKARAVNGGRKHRKSKSNSALPDYTETQRPDGVQTAA